MYNLKLNFETFSFIFGVQAEGYVEDEPIIQEEPCYGKRCTSNEFCCPGLVCVDVDGGQ